MTTTVSVATDGTTTTLNAPYDPSLPPKAKAVGGRWDGNSRAWVFDARDEQRVRALAREVYGTDGTDAADEPTVTVRIEAGQLFFGDHYGEIRLAGRSIARRPGRDVAVRLGDGVVVVAGRFPSRGGSVKNPCLNFVGEGIVLEVRDLPRSVAEKMAAEASQAVTIVDATAVSREALLAERARLTTRLAEIDAVLG